MNIEEIRTLLATYILQQLPNQDTTTGSVTDDLIITPFAKTTADIIEQTNNFVKTSDLFSTSGDFGSQQSFFSSLGISAQKSKASGYVRISTSNLSTTNSENIIPANSIITTSNKNYTIVYGGELNSSCYNIIEDKYIIALYVEAIDAGEASNLDAGQTFSSTSIVSDFDITNINPLTGGSDEIEDQQQYLDKVISNFKSFPSNEVAISSYIKSIYPTLEFKIINYFPNIEMTFKPTLLYETTKSFSISQTPFCFIPDAISISSIVVYENNTKIADIDSTWYVFNKIDQTIDLSRFIGTYPSNSTFVITYLKEGDSDLIENLFKSKHLDPNLSSLPLLKLSPATAITANIEISVQFPTVAKGNLQKSNIITYINSVINKDIGVDNFLEKFINDISTYVSSTGIGGRFISVNKFQIENSSSPIVSSLFLSNTSYISLVTAKVNIIS